MDETGTAGTPAQFIPRDEAADRAAVGHLAAALKELQAAADAAKLAGWGLNIRGNIDAASVLVALVVEDLATLEEPPAGWNTCFEPGCGYVWARRFHHNMRVSCPRCGGLDGLKSDGPAT